MKKKLLSLCAIILCLSFVLVGCGSNGVKFKLYIEEVKAVTTGEATDINLGTNIKLVGNVNYVNEQGYVKIQDTKGTDIITDDTYGVYSFKDSKIIFNAAVSSYHINFLTTDYYTYFTVRNDAIEPEGDHPGTPESYTLFSPNGETILSNLSSIQIKEDNDSNLLYAKYDGVVYESWIQQIVGEDEPYEIVVKVTGEKATDRTIIFTTKVSVGSVVGAEKEWAYKNSTAPLELTQYLMSQENIDGSRKNIHFYDILTGEEVSSVEIDTERTIRQYFIAETMYFQYITEVDQYETKNYDCIIEGDKYEFESYKFNIKTGKLTQIKLDNILVRQMHNDTLMENKADYLAAYRIVNKQLYDTSCQIFYFATEKGLVEVERAYGYVEKYGNNYYACDYDYNYYGAIIKINDYTLDKNGKVLVDLSAYDVEVKTENGLAIREGAGKYGFIDYTGKFLSNGYEYDVISTTPTDGYFIATKTEDPMTYYYKINAKTFEATALATNTGSGWKYGETEVASFRYYEFGYVVVKAGEGETPEFTYEFYKNDGTLFKTVTGLDIGIPSDAINTNTFYTDNNNGYHLIEINEKIYQIKING